MILRPAIEEDESVLFNIHRAVFQSHIEAIWGWNDEWQWSNFTNEVRSCNTSVVELDGMTIGYIQIREEPHQMYLQNIALCQNIQGRGIGSVLVKQIQRRASERKIPLTLSVFRTNDRALRFYEKLGFIRTGKTEAHIEMSWHAT
jgi:ribosomal protein S18 acetylase RimI-like enzyme